MKLHVYGDSFSIPNTPTTGVTNTWNEIVSNALDLENVNYAEYGVANEWIYGQVIDSAPKWEAGDHIIIQLTAPWRDWLLEDVPEVSNLAHCKVTDEYDKVDKNILKAIDYFLRYLYNPTKYIIQYNMVFNALNFIAADNLDKKILILPGFHPLPNFNGTLSEMCYKEFDSQGTAELFYDKYSPDPRINHLTAPNHKILGNRVLEFFQGNQLPDLTNDYHEKIITKNNYKVLDSYPFTC